MKKILASLLALCTVILCACNSAPANDNADQTTASGDTAAVTETAENNAETQEEFVRPTANYDGKTLTVLNMEEYYGANIRVDAEEQNGEALNDAIFERNRNAEEEFSFKLVEAKFGLDWSGGPKLIEEFSKNVLAGDNTYQAAYLPLHFGPQVINEGYLIDLYELDGLHLNGYWWDTDLNLPLEIDGKLYTSSSSAQLMSYELVWHYLFNKKVFDDRSLEYPYQIVRDGEWTFDKLGEYASQIASLNGAQSFAFTPESKAVYGIAGHSASPHFSMISADNYFVVNDGDGTMSYLGATERLLATIDKLSETFNITDGKVLFDDHGDLDYVGGYYYMFINNRAGFVTTELKGTTVLRTMDSDYGILPAPKLDEDQEEYVTYLNEVAGRFAIPTTNPDPEFAAVIFDVLSYDSYNDVLPIYRDSTLSQKGLRDEESIEMLNIIIDGRITELGKVYGFINDMEKELETMFLAGENTAASIMAKYEKTIPAAIDALIEATK